MKEDFMCPPSPLQGSSGKQGHTSQQAAMEVLLSALKKASCANYMLDGEVAVSLYPRSPQLERELLPDGSICDYEDGRKVGRWRPMAYTASIDAAISLTMKNLPDWHFHGGKSRKGEGYFWLLVSPDQDVVVHVGEEDNLPPIPTLPLAILTALVRAISAQHSDGTKP